MGYIRDGVNYYCEPKEKEKEMCREMDREKDKGKGVYVCVETNEKRKPKEPECHCQKHPEPQKILLECGCNSQDANFEINNGYVCEHQEFVLDTVRVDTTCLCQPLVKIEFSSLVFYEAEAEFDYYGGPAAESDKGKAPQAQGQAPGQPDLNGGGYNKKIKVDLLFELIRNCRGEKECVQSWRYINAFEVGCYDKLEVKNSEPFTVTFCDKACPECCEYKMIVKGKKFEGEFEALRVTKPDLSALAQGKCQD